MADPETHTQHPAIDPATVRALAAAVGLDIADERLSAVTVVLTELFDLAAQLDPLDLEGVEPDSDDPRTGWDMER
jgi:Asp-tRNA(Asn)/Glu-tRNA(Gln) amidotransferase C subunit